MFFVSAAMLHCESLETSWSFFPGLLKEYLRELPEPVFSSCLYQMLVDAVGVFLPNDPDGNAKLVFSILDCLPKANRVWLFLCIMHVDRNFSLSSELPCSPPGSSGLSDLSSNSKQDEPSQPGHLLRARAHAGHQWLSWPGVGTFDSPTAPNIEISCRNLAKKSGGALTP